MVKPVVPGFMRGVNLLASIQFSITSPISTGNETSHRCSGGGEVVGSEGPPAITH